MRQLSKSTRESILQATLSLLSRTEFSGVRTREIAAQAKISEATIFRYFHHKDEIVEAVLRETARRGQDELVGALCQVTEPRDILLALGRYHAAFAVKHREFIAVCHRQFSFPRPLAQRICQHASSFILQLETAIRKGMRTGVFRKGISARRAAIALYTVPMTVMMQHRIFGGKELRDEAFLRAAEGFYQFYLQAISAQGASK